MPGVTFIEGTMVHYTRHGICPKPQEKKSCQGKRRREGYYHPYLKTSQAFHQIRARSRGRWQDSRG